MSDEHKKDDLDQRVYPEDEHLRQLREVQEQADKQKSWQRQHWKKILLWVGAGLLVLALIFLAGYIPRHREQENAASAAKQREQELPQVEVVQVERTPAPSELIVPGTTSALTEAYLYARANGYIRRRLVDIGDHVRKGHLLATIEAPDLDQQVDQAREQLRLSEAQVSQQQAQLNLTRVTWERWKILVAKGVFSRQDGDQREADYQTQSAVYRSAERNVQSNRANLQRLLALQSYERITAPFDGIITQRNADVGALVGMSGAAQPAPVESSQAPSGGSANVGVSNTSGSTGTPNQSATPSTGEAQGGAIFAIARLDKLRILVSVPEPYAAEVREGMPAKVFIEERAEKPVDGTVTRTAKTLDQNTRTMLTEVDIENRERHFYPGMYTVVSFVQVRGVAPLVVPGDAVIIRQDRTSLAVVRDQMVQIVPVELGRDYGPSVEILSGIHDGELVIPIVTDEVREGVKVRPQLVQSMEQTALGGGAQTAKQPAAGLNQYGDQSIVNSNLGNTNQKGKQRGNQNPGQQQQQQKIRKQEQELQHKGPAQ